MSRAAVALAAGLALAGCGGDREVEVPRADPAGGATTTGSASDGSGRTAAGEQAAGARRARGERARATPAAVPRPPIVQRRIPYGAARRAQMAAYSRRHYGRGEWRLRPRAIVAHFTQIETVEATARVFARNRRDPELGELPGTCAHFVVDRDGTIHQLVDERVRCRHAFGVNHVSLGIEHVGFSDAEVMGNRRQLAASLALARWLACRHGIALRDVLGHAETVDSRWYTEIRPDRHTRSTHSDFRAATMDRYRARLARRGCGAA